MIDIERLIEDRPFDDRPWLILGKGPTFARRDELDLAQFNLLSLNHAVREVRVDIAHVIDIDVVEDCADVLESHCRYLVMPRYPNQMARPGLCLLEDYFDALPVLRSLDSQGRLCWYNLEGAPRIGSSPTIEVRYFSSEAALSLLATLGATTVRSLGVDGGSAYAPAFAAVAERTLLVNSQPSFDLQFAELDRIAGSRGVDYRPKIEPLRIFVGASPSETIPYRVLSDSIHRNSSIPVRVESLADVQLPKPRSRKSRPRTPFSFARFAIPERCNFDGRAVYLDSDMLVFGDVAELASAPFGGAHVLCTSQVAPRSWEDDPGFRPGPQFSVMVLDCTALRWRVADVVAGLQTDRYTYEELMFEFAIVDPARISASLDPAWNHLETYEAGKTKLVHFTVVPTQPWRSSANALRSLWLEALTDAVKRHAVDPMEVRDHAERGWVSRDLIDVVPAWMPSRPGGRTVAEVGLRAAIGRIDELEHRTGVRGALLRTFRPFARLVRQARARRPGSKATRLLERTSAGVRRRLR